MTARAALRLISATLPAGVRDRYREEWMADVAGARELGMSPWSVVGGAFGVAAGIDRELPAISGLPARSLMFRRMRVALAALAIAALLLVYGWLAGVWTTDAAGPLIGKVLFVVMLLAAGVGVIELFGALRAHHRARSGRAWGAASIVVAVMVVLTGVAMVFLPLLCGPLIVGGLIAIITVLATEDRRPQRAPLRRGPAFALAAFSAAGILGALAASVLHVYVWNPLAKLPGMTLDEIYAGLEAARELPSPVLPLGWIGMWGLVALALVVLAVLPSTRIRRLATARRIAGVGILGIALVAGGTWFLGFGMGMGIADAFMTTGHDAAASGQILSLIGVVFAIAAVLIGLLPARIRPAGPEGPAPEPAPAPTPHVENAGDFGTPA